MTGLRQRKAEETKHRDDLERDIDNIKRLIHDARMEGAYQILTNAFFGDEDSERQVKFDGFIYAAWSTRMDFSPFREGLRQAAELQCEITKTANKLAGLLDRIDETGVLCPDEFTSVSSLLRNTDHYSGNRYNPHIWQSMRGFVVGDSPQRERTESEQADIDLTEKREPVGETVSLGEEWDIDPEGKVSEELRRAWKEAPPLSSLLRTLSEAAKEFEPSVTGVIGAAIDSRQRSVKAEYLRAFGNVLTEECRFILTTDIMKAMAIAANVVINSPDVDVDVEVTCDDVRKALAKIRQ